MSKRMLKKCLHFRTLKSFAVTKAKKAIEIVNLKRLQELTLTSNVVPKHIYIELSQGSGGNELVLPLLVSCAKSATENTLS